MIADHVVVFSRDGTRSGADDGRSQNNRSHRCTSADFGGTSLAARVVSDCVSVYVCIVSGILIIQHLTLSVSVHSTLEDIVLHSLNVVATIIADHCRITAHTTSKRSDQLMRIRNRRRTRNQADAI